MSERNDVFDRLLRGQGRYVGDEARPGQLVMAVLRAPVAHGRITLLDADPARAVPGVVLVLTSRDLLAAGIGPLTGRAPVVGRDGPMFEPHRPVLADGRVVHVGQAVAAVVAETAAAALDGVEAIAFETEPLPVVVDPLTAEEAPAIWPGAPGNRCLRWQKGNAEETARLIESAAHVVALTVEHPRIAISPVEPRGALAEYSDAAGYTLTTPSQNVVFLRQKLAETLGIAQDSLRVLTHDVGGSFAVKIWPYPELVLALFAARRTGRPVRWIGERSEAFVADAAGRGRIDRARLALDGGGRFLAFEIDAVADLGAFCNPGGPSTVTAGAVRPFSQLYDIPGQLYAVTAVFTNAVPTDAYRGAGKPESTGTLERTIEAAARELGLDPFELRRRNLIRPERIPYDTPMGETIDAGDFPALAARAAVLADRPGAAARKAAAGARGRLHGRTIGFYMHASGGSTDERSEVRAMADGTVRVRSGSMDSGQSHLESLALVAAEALDLPPSRIRVEQGDSAWLDKAGGTGGSNLMPVAGNTVHRASRAMLDRARETAAEILEVATADLDYGAGAFRITGTDRSVGLGAIAARMEEDDGPGCLARLDFEGLHTTYPNGALACEVEVDPETGGVTVTRLAGVTDIGRVINPPAAFGQVIGGIGQSVGEALTEGMRYDGDGQPLNGSLMDYALPRARHLPLLAHEWAPTDSPNAPINAKGVGELASIGAPAVFVNAVLDALRPFGVRHIDMPLTPLKIWQALHGRG